jgi:hypothetical protein
MTIKNHTKQILFTTICTVALMALGEVAQARLPYPKNPNASYFTGGNIGSGRSRSLTNQSVSAVEFKEQFFVADGWQTSVSAGRSRAFWDTSAPRLKGRFAAALYNALQQLSAKGYTTVDITVWEGVRAFRGGSDGGWKMVGRDNPGERQRAAAQRQREFDRRQESANRRRNQGGNAGRSRDSAPSRRGGSRSRQASDYIEFIRKGECNTFGTGIFATNKGQRPITISVKVTAWSYKSTESIIKKYVVPGDEVYLGCTRWSTTTYKYKLTGAYYPR